MALAGEPHLPIQPRTFPGCLLRPQPHGVEKARRKARLVQNEIQNAEKPEAVESSLMKRFFALPAELRNEVYRHLLVQPCKFDLDHKETCNCETRVDYVAPGPGFYTSGHGGNRDPDDGSCATCWTYRYSEPQVKIFKSPLRSKWAKPHTNEYVCDNCYWNVAGVYYGDPCLRSLRCLCTRRTNLEILLINKRFYNEAAPIFWSENCFAFEYPILLTGFLRAVSSQVRSWLRRISFMPSHDRALRDDTTTSEDKWYSRLEPPDDEWGWDNVKSCWNLLRQCAGLTWLELDVYCLRRLDWALLIRMIHVNGPVIFSRRPGEDEIPEGRIERSNKIWLSIGRRKPAHSSTTDLMIKSMTSSRCIKSKTLKRHYADLEQQENAIYGGDIYPDLPRSWF